MESCSYTTGHFRFSIRFLFLFFLFVRYLPLPARMISTNKKDQIFKLSEATAPNCNKSDLICFANEGISRNRFRADKISENYLIIVIIPSFTLDSIYSINASGAEQMPETNNLNQT